jgi:uncharacterized metal-binding protein YceD (DUF177 family)
MLLSPLPLLSEFVVKIVVDALPPEGRTVRAALEDGWLFEAARQSVEAKPRTLSCELKVAKQSIDRDSGRPQDRDPRFVVEGTLAVSWRQACHRCVRPLEMTMEGPVSLTYVRGALPDCDEVDLEAVDLDIGWFEGGSLDLADVVSEQLALWLPDRVICAEERAVRSDSTDVGVCSLHQQGEGGAGVSRQTPFSGLANWKPPQ